MQDEEVQTDAGGAGLCAGGLPVSVSYTHLKSVLEAAGKKVGMIGTNGIYFMGRHQETANNTPESYELQKTFRQFLDAG